ncbi:hypothetical protein VTN77DRAFT_9701 [Rasamsonia byssochlamydoides]|uniref:uncharacterized protein n=1 Tax=Rasamsonia byssochlamydoides TaxID=89139 RepID=UPI003743EF69
MPKNPELAPLRGSAAAGNGRHAKLTVVLGRQRSREDGPKASAVLRPAWPSAVAPVPRLVLGPRTQDQLGPLSTVPGRKSEVTGPANRALHPQL